MCSINAESPGIKKEQRQIFDPDLYAGLVELLTPMIDENILNRIMKTRQSNGDMETWVRMLIDSMDDDNRREFLGNLVYLLLPLDRLVPDIYAEWRPMVRDAVTYLSGYLSEDRLVPKIIEQFMLPPGTSLERRVVAFISRMPSMQKLGQTIARNRNLSPGFQTELIKLENMIRDVSPDQVRSQIESLLGPLINAFDIRLDRILHAEASVSAVMGFSWQNPESGRREDGVFKVLKPYIRECLSEEINLIKQLADHLENRSKDYLCSGVGIKEFLYDVMHKMEAEIDTLNEQANLESAGDRYRKITGIRVPRLIHELSGPGITAMSFEKGIKVTDAFQSDAKQRDRLSARIIEALVAHPLLNGGKEAVFHADPHAGNLFVDEKTGDLVILDWAMTDNLAVDERRLIVKLFSAVMLRDEYMIYNTVTRLNRARLSDGTSRHVNRLIHRFFDKLSPVTRPGFEQVLSLLDKLVIAGVGFSSSLMIFRKVLMTMNGLLHDMHMESPLENVLARYLLDHGTVNAWNTNRIQLTTRIPLSYFDILSLFWSAQWMGVRIGMQTGRWLLNINRD